MIQRRQSIYLFLGSAIAALLLILNLTFFESSGLLENNLTESIEVGYFTTAIVDNGTIQNSSLIGSLAAYAGLTFLTIFFFKNRKRQSLICTLAFAFLILAFVMMYKNSLGAEYFVEVSKQDLKWPAIIPVSLLMLQFLALRGIKQDEALIKSLDRIR
jgi:hypothetical protein